MMGLQSVTATGDTIPAVLFGVPGTVASAATIMDGYPMAKKGETGRALGASFTSNVLGGLFGALLLGVSIPILRPVMLFIGSPELLSFRIFGISLVAAASDPGLRPRRADRTLHVHLGRALSVGMAYPPHRRGHADHHPVGAVLAPDKQMAPIPQSAAGGTPGKHRVQGRFPAGKAGRGSLLLRLRHRRVRGRASRFVAVGVRRAAGAAGHVLHRIAVRGAVRAGSAESCRPATMRCSTSCSSCRGRSRCSANCSRSCARPSISTCSDRSDMRKGPRFRGPISLRARLQKYCGKAAARLARTRSRTGRSSGGRSKVRPVTVS